MTNSPSAVEIVRKAKVVFPDYVDKKFIQGLEFEGLLTKEESDALIAEC